MYSLHSDCPTQRRHLSGCTVDSRLREPATNSHPGLQTHDAESRHLDIWHSAPGVTRVVQSRWMSTELHLRTQVSPHTQTLSRNATENDRGHRRPPTLGRLIPWLAPGRCINPCARIRRRQNLTTDLQHEPASSRSYRRLPEISGPARIPSSPHPAYARETVQKARERTCR
jgi:hypothetical protein